jgi:cold shock CspA family protein
MQPSQFIEARIINEVEQLEAFYPGIIGCRVVVDLPHKHHRNGNPYIFKIGLRLPGYDIVVNHEPTIHTSRKSFNETKVTKSEEVNVVHKAVLTAINAAFDTARRQLQDFARRQRSDVKTHEETPHARVSKIYRKKGYGVLRTPLGRAIYFDKHSVRDSSFSDLRVGTRVTFVEEQGENGPEAVLVRVAGKPSPPTAI